MTLKPALSEANVPAAVPDKVECHSSFAYAERPVALYWQDERHEITEILKSWDEPDSRHFSVAVEDGRVFELVYSASRDSWQVILR
jgi:hypothetical protein